MADRTQDFTLCLQKRGIRPIPPPRYDVATINSFLQEAYSINARIADLTRELRAIRPPYLSTAAHPRRRVDSSHDRSRPLTDQEREAFDAQSKLLLRQLNGAITGLKQAEDVRIQTADSIALSKRAKGGLGALGRWAAGGAVTAKSPEEEQDEAERKTVAAVRESVIFYLQRKNEQAGRALSEMIEVRLGREVEKSKSILYKSRVTGGILYADEPDHPASFSPPSSPTKRKRQSAALGYANGVPADTTNQELSQDQLQLFAEENNELLRHYEDQLDAVRTAERSILEISELHSTLHANLEQQSEHIEQLVQESYLTDENLQKGNKELKRASERRSTAQAVFYATLGFCSFLVVWDLVF